MSGQPEGGFYGSVEKATKPAKVGAITELDEQLDLLYKTIEHLRERLAPVLSNYHDELAIRSDRPTEEPVSFIRGRAERVGSLRRELDSIIGQLDI
jgi:hypothetical protein